MSLCPPPYKYRLVNLSPRHFPSGPKPFRISCATHIRNIKDDFAPYQRQIYRRGHQKNDRIKKKNRIEMRFKVAFFWRLINIFFTRRFNTNDDGFSGEKWRSKRFLGYLKILFDLWTDQMTVCLRKLLKHIFLDGL